MSYGTAPLGTRPHGAVDAAAGPVSHDLAGNAQAAATASGLLYGSAVLDGAATAQATATGNIAQGINLASSPVIYARPASTLDAGGFLPSDGTSPLHTLIDEVTPDDADYIYATGGAQAEFALPPLVDPGFHTGHVLRARLWANKGWAAFMLKQGATTIADLYFYGTAPAVPATFELHLTAAQAAAITNYADLRIAVGGLMGARYFSWAEFAIEQGGAATAAGSVSHGVPLASSAVATAAATGGVSHGVPLAAPATAQASASATIATAGSVDLAATAAATASASGAVSHGVPLAASVAAVSSASAQAAIGKPLSASAAASASASATASTVGSIDLAASATASATASAALTHGVPLAASAAATAAASGNAAVLKALYAAAAGNAQAMAGLGIGVQLTAAANSHASASGAVSLDIRIHGAAWAQATGAGALSASPPLFAATPGYVVRQSPRAFTARPAARTWRAVG